MQIEGRWVAAAAIAVCFVVAVPAMATTLLDVKEKYEAQIRETETQYKDRVRSAADRYVKALEAVLQEAMAEGALEACLAIKAEIKRFDDEKNIPADASGEQQEVVTRLQSKVRKTIAAAGTSRDSRLKSVAEKYVAVLESLKRKMTTEDRIDEALAVDEEKGRMEYILADMSSGDDVATTPATTETAGTKRDPIPQAPRLPAELVKGLVFHYPFNANEGVRVTDASGKGSHGKVNGAQWLNDAARGGVYAFGGRSVVVADTGESFRGREGVTVSAWLFIEERTEANIVCNDALVVFGTRGKGYALDGYVHSGGEWRSHNSEMVVPAKWWHHCAMTYSTTQAKMRLYVDGRVVSTFRLEVRRLGRPEGLTHIGGFLSDKDGQIWSGFRGMMDDVMVYDRALSEREILKLYKIQK